VGGLSTNKGQVGGALQGNRLGRWVELSRRTGLVELSRRTG